MITSDIPSQRRELGAPRHGIWAYAQRTTVGALACAAWLGPATEAAAQVGAVAERVQEATARAAVIAVRSDRPTQLNVTVNGEGLPVVKGVLQQAEGEPEVHLEALLAQRPLSPRDPALPRRQASALIAQLLNRDQVHDEDSPYLILDIQSPGESLQVNNLSAFLDGAVSVDTGETPGFDRLVGSRELELPASMVRALDTLKEIVRGRFDLDGSPCDAAAAIYPRSPDEIAVDLEPRCRVASGDLGILAFDLRTTDSDAQGNPVAAVLSPAERSDLAPEVGASLLLVPRTISGQLYPEDALGLVVYGAEDSGPREVDLALLRAGALDPGSGPCIPDATTLCIDDRAGDGRFELTLTWQTAQNGGMSGTGFATPLGSVGLGQGGLFSFFSGNPELLVKVLNACALNGRFWVFGAPTTTLGFELRIVDTVARDAGASSGVYLRRIVNPDGQTAAALADTDAFATCSF